MHMNTKYILAASKALLAVAALVNLSGGAKTIPDPRPFPPAPVPPPIIRFTPRANEKPMTVERYSVDAQVNGLFATVSTTISFGNPNGRVLEGELEFPLPEGASVCGYALDVNGHMRDGVVV